MFHLLGVAAQGGVMVKKPGLDRVSNFRHVSQGWELRRKESVTQGHQTGRQLGNGAPGLAHEGEPQGFIGPQSGFWRAAEASARSLATGRFSQPLEKWN